MKPSRIGLLGFFCVALTAWVVWGAPRSATAVGSATTAGSADRVIIYPRPGDTLAKLRALGLSQIQTYGAYWLANATPEQLKQLQQSLPGRVESANHFNQIDFEGGIVDATKGAAVPERLREAHNETRRLRIVQFKGPVLPEWLKQLRAISSVRVINYVPNNAYLISINSVAEGKLQSLIGSNGPVQWIGVYQPAFKVAAGLQQTNGLVKVKIAVLNDETTLATLQVIRRYVQGEVEEHRTAVGEWLATTQINANDLPSIAQLPGVLWIQPWLPAQSRDELQALVLAAETNLNIATTWQHFPTNGASYWDFLFNPAYAGHSFSTEPTDYPLLDICDTGVDAAPPYPNVPNEMLTWHPSFNYYIGYGTRFGSVGDFGDATKTNPLSCAFVSSRKVYDALLATGGDVNGHGTRVASIALGYDRLANEISINCVNQALSSVISTGICRYCTSDTLPLPPSGVSLSPIGGSGCNPPAGATLINIPGVTGVVPGTSCGPGGTDTLIIDAWQFINPPTCGTSDPSLVIPNAVGGPPWYLSRRDQFGFQLGLGVSPVGLFGASSSAAAASTPEAVVGGAYLNFARISNNSWTESFSFGNAGSYSANSQSYDRLTRDAVTTGGGNPNGAPAQNQEMLFVFAAGNDNGSSPGPGGYGDVLIMSPATAKNVLTVGATKLRIGGSTFDMDGHSSFGPTRDGRNKPDVVAPGAGVAAAISQASYSPTDCGGCNPNSPVWVACGAPTYQIISKLYNNVSVSAGQGASFKGNWGVARTGGSPEAPEEGGTSYAAAAVSGGAQLLWWHYQNVLLNLPPSPAMLKAYIMNSARYLPITNALTHALDKLPSIAQGMGMLDLRRMFDSVPRVLRDEGTPRATVAPLYATNSLLEQTYLTKPGQSYELAGEVADSTQPFRVTLAWTDAPGNPANLKQLVNDLDLEVAIKGAARTYYGNVFSTEFSDNVANPVHDRLNNVESVYLPAGYSGAWTVTVRAASINGNALPNLGTMNNQDFVLVVYNGKNPTDSANPATNNACQAPVQVTQLPFVWTNNLTAAAGYKKMHPSPSVGRGGMEEWFRLSQLSPGTVINVDTKGSGFDTILSVWSGACGTLVELGSNNDAAGNTLQSALSFMADGVSDYYIIAEPHNNGLGGQLVLNIQASSSPITLAPTSLTFSNQAIGTPPSSWQTVTYHNGLTIPVQVQKVSVTTNEFVILSDNCSGTQIEADGSCEINIGFAPKISGVFTGRLEVTDDATGSPRTNSLYGAGVAPLPQICLSTSSLAFPTTETISSNNLSLVVSNCGSLVLNNFGASLSGLGASDFKVTVPCSTIAAGGMCTLTVGFAPTTNTLRLATLTLSGTGAGSQTVQLSGTGKWPTPLACLPSTVDFGAVTLGTNRVQSIVVSNCGTALLKIGSISFTGSGADNFEILPGGDSCTSNGIPPNAACSFSVVYIPAAVGSVSATVTITDNTTAGQHQINLTAACVNAQPDASISSKLAIKSFVGKKILNATGEKQEIKQAVRRGKTCVFYVMAQNAGSDPDRFTVSGPGNSADYTVQYFLGTVVRGEDGVDITKAVTEGRYKMSTMGAGAITGTATLLRVVVTANKLATKGANSMLITIASIANPSKLDTVKATFTIR